MAAAWAHGGDLAEAAHDDFEWRMHAAQRGGRCASLWVAEHVRRPVHRHTSLQKLLDTVVEPVSTVGSPCRRRTVRVPPLNRSASMPCAASMNSKFPTQPQQQQQKQKQPTLPPPPQRAQSAKLGRSSSVNALGRAPARATSARGSRAASAKVAIDTTAPPPALVAIATPGGHRRRSAAICTLPAHVRRDVRALFDAFATQQRMQRKLKTAAAAATAAPTWPASAATQENVPPQLALAGGRGSGSGGKSLASSAPRLASSSASLLGSTSTGARPSRASGTSALEMEPTEKCFERLLRLYYRTACADEVRA